MKILFATGEAFPFIKTGGLGDVSYSLPKALVQKEKLDVRVILPKYSKISNELLKDARHLGHKEIWVAHHNEYVGIEEVELEGVIYYFVDNERYFRRLNVYGEYDDCERFLFFSKAVVETMDITDFKPDIIHCNDWQTGLIPIYLKERGIYDVKTVFSIHNLRFQGFFYNNVIEDLLEIDRARYFQDDGIRYYDMFSFLMFFVQIFCHHNIIHIFYLAVLQDLQILYHFFLQSILCVCVQKHKFQPFLNVPFFLILQVIVSHYTDVHV